MTKSEYIAALRKLKLTPSGKATARTLGLSIRQCQRYAKGESRVPGPVANLLDRLCNKA